VSQILQKLTISHLVKTAVFWNSKFPYCVHNKPPLVPYPCMNIFIQSHRVSLTSVFLLVTSCLLN